MRILSILFYILAALGAGMWAFFYTYAVALACAFGSPNATSCHTPMPWEMTGEDLRILVILPGLGVLVLLGIAILFGRLAKRANR